MNHAADLPSRPTITDYAAVVRALSAWFVPAQRDLPWREAINARDPYRVLVSEVMLQQTTVAAVVPFYRRFIERFPNVQTLAQAEIDEVLPLWAGLGYYSRARNLHRCARVVIEQFGGEFPRQLSKVLSLPGVGRYTAGALTSIAFDAPNPIVDANVARVIARVEAIEGDIKAPANQKVLWREAAVWVRTAHQNGIAPSQLNPSIMELGALICRPRDPDCPRCPIASWCAARKQNRQRELPHFAPKAAFTELFDACAFIREPPQSTLRCDSPDEARVLLRQRSHEAKIWWRGMWELPRITRREEESAPAALKRLMSEEFGVEATIGARLKTVRHGVTTHRITLDCHAVEWNGLIEESRARWFSSHEIEALAIPSTMRALLKWLALHPRGDQQPGLFG